MLKSWFRCPSRRTTPVGVPQRRHPGPALSAATTVGLLGVLLGAGLSIALAGPLTPPPGPVTDTSQVPGLRFKHLGEIEPRTNVQTLPGSATALHVISAPGSYYLTANIVGVSGRHGIHIASDNVTLDLNGFSVIGVFGAGDAISQANTAIYHRNIEVRNGVIRSWPGSGINLQTDGSRFENLRISNNTLAGLNLNASVSVLVRGCTILDCQGGGLFSGNATIVENVSVVYTLTVGDAPGMSVADGSAVRHCTVRGVRGTGIFAGGSSTITDNTVSSARADGINVGQRSTVVRNTVTGSTNTGIVLSGAGCLVSDNTLSGNAQGSTTNGGIVSSQNNHRIDSNTLSSNGVGVRLTGNGSLITRNTFRQNTANYTISASNSLGPPVTVSLIGDISNSTNPNHAHPWANFIH